MSLNTQKGNMYPFVTHTWNVIKGKCPHDCSYCYMKIFRQPELHFDEGELKTDLGEGNFIFVGSSTDKWAHSVPTLWIQRALSHCCLFKNRYLFQSKNPERFLMWTSAFPKDTILGTTIESNRHYPETSKAPPPYYRTEVMSTLPYPRMVSIEPIMDFDLATLIAWVARIKPEFVSIGADSKGHKLPEPPPDKVQRLIEELQAITTVKIKDNLKRILAQNT